MRKVQIDDYIYGLEYDANELLAFEGTTVTNITPKTGEFQNGEYIVVTREKCTIDSNYDVCVSDENRNVTYPGNLIFADKRLVDGAPTPIALERQPITLTLNLPGMTKDNYLEVMNVNYSNVSGAINELLNRWYTKYTEYNTIPANMSYEGGLIHDKNEMKLRFGCEASFLENELGVNFDAVEKNEISVYIAKYKQVFYTASIEPFNYPSDAFAESVSVDDLKRKNICDSQPPAYIGAVSYGREVYVKFESKCSKETLSAILDGSVTVKGVTPSAEGNSTIANESIEVRCSLVVRGGNPESINGLYTDKDFINTINKVIFDNVTLSATNPAYPLSYKVVFLKDNSVAKFCGTSEYVKETTEKFSAGEISLRHKGAYIAEFYVSWDEIVGYNQSGEPEMTHREWGENGNNKTAGFETKIALSGNVRNINIMSRGKTGLVWDPWHTSFDKRNIALQPSIWLKISGTTLNQVAESNV